MKPVINGINLLSRASRALLATSLVFAGACDAGDDAAFESDDDDRGAGLSIMHCKTVAGVGDGSTKFVYETTDFMGTDDFSPVHVTRERPGGVVDDFGWIQLAADPYGGTLSWDAPNKMTMTVVMKQPNNKASIRIEHAANGAGKPRIVAKADNGFCTFKPAPKCLADQRVVCNWGACACQTVGKAGGWYTFDVGGGSVAVALTGMVLVDGPLPVGDAAAGITILGIVGVVAVAKSMELIHKYVDSVGGEVTSEFKPSQIQEINTQIQKVFHAYGNGSEECESCLVECLQDYETHYTSYDLRGKWCATQGDCKAVCK